MFRRQESYAHNLLLEGSGSGVAENKLKVAELWEGNPGHHNGPRWPFFYEGSIIRLVVKSHQQKRWIKKIKGLQTSVDSQELLRAFLDPSDCSKHRGLSGSRFISDSPPSKGILWRVFAKSPVFQISPRPGLFCVALSRSPSIHFVIFCFWFYWYRVQSLRLPSNLLHSWEQWEQEGQVYRDASFTQCWASNPGLSVH